MKHITLTPSQALIALGSHEPVEVRDVQGRTVAYLYSLQSGDTAVIEPSKRSPTHTVTHLLVSSSGDSLCSNYRAEDLLSDNVLIVTCHACLARRAKKP
jgi:hypothetical protein